MFKKVILALAATLASSWGTAGLLISNKSDYHHLIKTIQPSPSRKKNNNFFRNTSLGFSYIVKCITQIGSKIYVGGFGALATHNDNGLYISSDNGKTFVQNPSFSKIHVYAIAQINSKIYVGTGFKGLWVSSDGGQTFVQNKSLRSHASILFITQIGNKIYVGTPLEGLWVSSDGGQTFVWNTSLKDYYVDCIIQIGSKIYVGTDNGLWVSSDNCKTFVQNPSFQNNASINCITQIDSKIYVGTYVALWVSSDGGQTFVRKASFKNPAIINCITQIDSKIYVGKYDGLWVSGDGGQTFVQNPSIVGRLGGFNINIITQIGSKIYVGGYCLWEKNNNILPHIKTTAPLKYYWINTPKYGTNPIYEIDASTDTFTFDQSWVHNASVTIGGNPPIYINPQNPYILKNTTSKPQIDIITIMNASGTTRNYYFVMEGTDLGMNTITWNGTNTLDIYFSEKFTNYIMLNWEEHQVIKGFLTWIINDIDMNTWNNVWTNKNFETSVVNFIGSDDPQQSNNDAYNNIDNELSYPQGGDEKAYAIGLQNKIASLNPTHGIYFHIVLNNSNQIQNRPYPYNPQTYYNQIIFNQ